MTRAGRGDAGRLDLTPHSGGTALRLRVHAGARRNGVTGTHDGALKISVTTAPERGRANRAVLELLAETLGVPLAALELVAGATSPRKTVRVDLDPEEVAQRLGPLPGAEPTRG